jgi:hypothetical protein
LGIRIVGPKVSLQEPNSYKDSKNGKRLEIAVQYCKSTKVFSEPDLAKMIAFNETDH